MNMKAVNIDWDVDYDEVYEKLDEMTVSNAAKVLELPEQTYANMSTSERHDYAYDKFRHSPGSLYDFMELPEEVVLPKEIVEEDAADYLSDTYGYCINSLSIK